MWSALLDSCSRSSSSSILGSCAIPLPFITFIFKLREQVFVVLFRAKDECLWQTKAAILNGTMETTEATSFRLAALQLAVQSQSYRPQDQRRGVLSREFSKWIPKGWLACDDELCSSSPSFFVIGHLDEIKARGLSDFYVERRIYAGYELVKDLSASDATFAYLKAVKDLPL